MQREATAGKVGGRTQEIQRLIGRSLRSVTNLPALGERTIWVDCDVIQADGGTRTASITGAFVALALAMETLRSRDVIKTIPLNDSVAAISVGIVDGEALLDLAYEDDSRAEVDMNVVKTGDGRFIEVQGTAEALPFGRPSLDALLDHKPELLVDRISPKPILFIHTSDDEIAQARKMIAAFDLPESKGKGVVQIEGKMVERLHAEMARRTVTVADAIAGRT